MKNLHIFFISFFALFILWSCSNSQSMKTDYHIGADNSLTEYDKEHLNNYNSYVDLVDSIIIAHKNGDTRSVGLLADKMIKVKGHFSYWSKHDNPSLEEQIDHNCELLNSELSSAGVPSVITYRINFSEVYIYPQNGKIVREGYNKLNPFTTYYLSVDEDGYVVRTVSLDGSKPEIDFDFNSISSIKDLKAEYPFENFDAMVVTKIQ